MDAADAELDIKLQKISGDLIADFDRALPVTLRRPDGRGGTRVRSWVRRHQAVWSTCWVLDQFQELPQLLDPHLPQWIPLLANSYLEYLQTPHRMRHDPKRAHLVAPLDEIICKVLYSFCKVRGEKIIVRFFNPETRYLEPILSAIEEAEKPRVEGDVKPSWCWEQRYIVLLWLSHLMLAPFDLSTISSLDIENDSLPVIPDLEWPKDLPGITMRIIPLAIKHLASPGKERDGAKTLLVRTAMRRDMQKLGVLECLVRWALNSLRPRKEAPLQTTYFYLGVLSLLAGLLQSSAETSDMEKYMPAIFQTVQDISTSDTEHAKTIVSLAPARKMMLKVSRSVIVSLLRQAPQSTKTTELTETAIEYLLESLSDNDTPVRLAASKSLSIITLKLDPDMASQVVEAVLESLNRNVLWTKVSSKSGAKPVRDLSSVDNVEWHGLMLTLSHLLYRRSPPARQLSDIVHALLLGLSFEQRGTSGTSIGTNVRDAACFGMWALARRYSTDELLAVPTKSVFAAKSHPASSSIIQVLGTELVTTASLDSAGNIRRGASAALQELIGRHPDMVEKGIAVVQTVDYHAVARRSRAIETVATNATKLAGQYGEAIVDGLLGWRGVGDLDDDSRRVSGTAFGVLIAELSSGDPPEEPYRRLDNSIQLIVERLGVLYMRQVEERHGLLTCFASVLDQFPEFARKAKDQGCAVDRSLVHKILGHVSDLVKECNTIDYRRPELIAEGASRLVVSSLPVMQTAALSTPSYPDLEIGKKLLAPSHSEGCLALASALDSAGVPNEQNQTLISKLHRAVPNWLQSMEMETIDPASSAAIVLLLFSPPVSRITILNKWAEMVQYKPTSASEGHGHGFFYALAMTQPLAMRETKSKPGEDPVCTAFLGRWKVDDDVEVRVAILRSLMRSRTLQVNPVVFLDLLDDALNDYTTVTRGDIGSLVRHQAMKAVTTLWEDVETPSGGGEWVEASVKKLLYSILRLSAEKLDRVRPQAQVVISLTLQEKYAEQFKPLINSSKAYFDMLLSLVSMDCLKPRVAQAVGADRAAWMGALMSGLVTSADTGNDTLIVASRAALTGFCEVSGGNLEMVCAALMHNLRTRQTEDRVLVPTLEIIAFLFHVGLFQQCKSVDVRNLCLYTQKSSYKTGNIRKVLSCVKVYGGIAALADLDTDGGKDAEPGVAGARKRLGALMMHPRLRVRSAVVDELWGLLGEEEGAEQALMSVDWSRADRGKIKDTVEKLRLG